MEHDNVNHPKHYTEGFAPVNIECIDITRHLGFRAGNAFKYVWRAGKKGDGVEDLDKARWYLRDIRMKGAEPVSAAAKAVFELLPSSTDSRYSALSSIVFGNYSSAIRYIDMMIHEWVIK